MIQSPHSASHIFLISLILSFTCYSFSFAQKQAKEIQGVVIEKDDNSPIPGASIQLPDYGLWAITDTKGHFVVKNVPNADNITIVVRMVGMVTYKKNINLATYKSKNIKIAMEEESFGLDEVVVTATNNRVGASTSSSISRNAIDHLQATSLSDIMELLPGQTSSNPTLSSPARAQIRQVQADALNSLGTSLVINGSPLSNNANMQISNTASDGVLNTNFTSTAGSGNDLRQISVDNIESVDVIRGIPSVEYGDLTSGVIIVNKKAGAFPWQINSKINPILTQVSLGKGFNLGKKSGNISFGVDYAKSLSDERRPYQGYSRLSTNMIYSNNISKSVSSTTELGFVYDLDVQKLDPSDTKYQRKRSAKNSSYRFSTNILWSADYRFLKYIRLNLSANYAIENGYYQELKGNFGYMITTAMNDGCISSNVAGDVKDIWGNVITNSQQIDPSAKTNFLPYEFLTKTQTKGRPINIFAKVTSGMFAECFGFNNKILFGSDWKTDVNHGQGIIFDPLYPTTEGLRMRPFSSIPALNQLGMFAEDNIQKDIFSRSLKIQVGVRAELIQPGRSEGSFALSPRFNVSYEIVPKIFILKAGWGIAMKAPPLLYLYPDKAYFDFLNYDNIATTDKQSPERLCVITTKVYDTTNDKLKIAKNTKKEIGFDLSLGQVNASVTAYSEKLINGYDFGSDLSTFHQFEHIRYDGKEQEGTYPLLFKKSSSNVIINYLKPLNSKVNDNKGIEFDINFGQIKSIHTTVVFNGAYMVSKSYSRNDSYYSKNPDVNGNYYNIGIYSGGNGSKYERFLTNLRVIHNIPKISLLVSLSMQTIWSDRQKYLGLDNQTPYAYLSSKDLSYHLISDNEQIASEIQKPILQNNFITDYYSPMFLFNFRLTKEMKRWGGFSFFVNNLFMTRPLEESKRNPGTYKQRNPEQFFGAEIKLKF